MILKRFLITFLFLALAIVCVACGADKGPAGSDMSEVRLSSDDASTIRSANIRDKAGEAGQDDGLDVMLSSEDLAIWKGTLRNGNYEINSDVEVPESTPYNITFYDVYGHIVLSAGISKDGEVFCMGGQLVNQQITEQATEFLKSVS